MGFSLIDLEDENRFVPVNFWNWRPTIEILRRSGLLDASRLDRLGEQASGERVSGAEAKVIASYVSENVLPSLSQVSRVRLDGSVTNAPDDLAFHREPEDMHENYGATRAWLESFASFCETSSGFKVL